MRARLTDGQLQAAREAYAYPLARLVIADKGESPDVEWPGVIRLRATFDPYAWKTVAKSPLCVCRWSLMGSRDLSPVVA